MKSVVWQWGIIVIATIVLLLGWWSEGIGSADEATTTTPGLPGMSDPTNVTSGTGPDATVPNISDATDLPPQSYMVAGLLGDTGDRNWDNYELSGERARFGVDPMGMLTGFFFAQGRLVMASAAWLLDQVLRFDVGRMLTQLATTLADTHYRVATMDLSLPHFMYTVAIANVGYQVFRNRTSVAVSELVAIITITTLGGYVIDNLEKVSCSTVDIVTTMTVGTISLGSDAQSLDTELVSVCTDGTVEPPTVFSDQMFAALVHEPFLLLQWGTVPEPGTACRVVADAVVGRGQWGTDDRPREAMRNAGCDELAEFNAVYSNSRLGTSVLYGVVALAFLAAVVMTTGTLLVAQVGAALLILALPWTAVVAVVPGPGREMLASWVHAAMKNAVLFIGSGFFLSLVVASVEAIGNASGGRPPAERIGMVLLVMFGLLFVRSKAFAAMNKVAYSTARHLAPGVDIGPQGKVPRMSPIRVDSIAIGGQIQGVRNRNGNVRKPRIVPTRPRPDRPSPTSSRRSPSAAVRRLTPATRNGAGKSSTKQKGGSQPGTRSKSTPSSTSRSQRPTETVPAPLSTLSRTPSPKPAASTRETSSEKQRSANTAATASTSAASPTGAGGSPLSRSKPSSQKPSDLQPSDPLSEPALEPQRPRPETKLGINATVNLSLPDEET